MDVNAEHGAVEDAANAPASTPSTSTPLTSSSPAGTDAIAAALADFQSAVAQIGDATASIAKEQASTTETLAAIKRAREAGDLAEVDRLKAEWAANNPPPAMT